MESTETYDNQMLEAFVDKPEKNYWYKNAFDKFEINGVEKPSWVWSWWAFGGGWLFLLYRKTYIPALMLFVATLLFSMISNWASLILAILAGGYGPYFVYKTHRTKRAEIEAAVQDQDKRIETMRAVGGTNQWAIWLAYLFGAFFILGILAAFIIPILISSSQH